MSALLLQDQAAGLRGLAAPTSRTGLAPLVAVASGKGGVGKTFVAVNLALALLDLGFKPLLVDLDWGLANVDVALGLAPRRHAGHVLSGECPLEEALLEHRGLTILPNGCGEQGLLRFHPEDRAGLLETARRSRGRDLLLADTHPGIGHLSLESFERASLVALVTTPEPTALADSYALLKVLRERGPVASTGLVINNAATPEQASEAAAHLNAVAGRFLQCELPVWATVLADGAVTRSVQRQEPLLAVNPRSAAAAGIRQLAAQVRSLLARQEVRR